MGLRKKGTQKNAHKSRQEHEVGSVPLIPRPHGAGGVQELRAALVEAHVHHHRVVLVIFVQFRDVKAGNPPRRELLACVRAHLHDVRVVQNRRRSNNMD